MRKIVLLIAALFITSMCVTSCLKDGESTAEVNYYGRVDSICYSDSADTVWNDKIIEALTKMTVTYTAFATRDTTNSGMASYAIYNCNVKALNIYSNKLNGVNLATVKKNIIFTASDSLPSIDSLNTCTLYSTLVSSYDTVRSFVTIIR